MRFKGTTDTIQFALPAIVFTRLIGAERFWFSPDLWIEVYIIEG